VEGKLLLDGTCVFAEELREARDFQKLNVQTMPDSVVAPSAALVGTAAIHDDECMFDAGFGVAAAVGLDAECPVWERPVEGEGLNSYIQGLLTAADLEGPAALSTPTLFPSS
jgi:hypothetical protein